VFHIENPNLPGRAFHLRRNLRHASLLIMFIKNSSASRAMKRINMLIAPLVCAFTAVQASAQPAPLPKLDANNPATPAVQPSATPAPTVPVPIAIPEDLMRAPGDAPSALPDVPTIPQLNESFKPAPLSAAAQQQQLNIESRKLRNRVQNEAQVKAALAHAEAAPNDLEKRKRLAKYYDAYYGRMIALATTPELKQFIRERKSESLVALKQPRVRPELLSSVGKPDPAASKPTTAAAAATPVPAPSPAPPAVAEPVFPSPFSTPAPVQP
jgi:hypothetical protein